MNELEIKIRVNALINNLIEQFMEQNQVSASVMVDALNAKLTNLYPRVQQEYFAALDVARQQAEQAQQQAEQAQQQTSELQESSYEEPSCVETYESEEE
jgi:hypothetical protein